MFLTPDKNSSKLVIIYCILTTIYLPLLLSFLLYTDSIYQIGTFKCISLVLGLCGLEILKFSFSFYYVDISYLPRESKTSKIKKYYFTLKIKELFKCAYLLVGSTAVFYIVAVLFGAPLLSECEETLMFSILITSLSLFPSCLHLGADNTISLMTGIKQLQHTVADLLLKNLRLTLLGAWVAAVVIPLDWDRPWQQWPIPCSIGAMIGFFLSHLFVLIRCIPVPNILTKLSVK